MPNRPIILGIVGDSAAGKTTLTRGIAQVLGEENVTVICIDDYHRYDWTQRAQIGISALHPDCNYLDIIQQHLNLLRTGQSILKPIYNHHTGTFDPPEYIGWGRAGNRFPTLPFGTGLAIFTASGYWVLGPFHR